MDVPTNPFAILTFISAPAVLTNASCVLLFGTGNRYGRAIDRVHELADVVEGRANLDEGELRLRIRQLSAAETRTLLIVRALTCFYSAVRGEHPRVVDWCNARLRGGQARSRVFLYAVVHCRLNRCLRDDYGGDDASF
jgi:hypothetical protein